MYFLGNPQSSVDAQADENFHPFLNLNASNRLIEFGKYGRKGIFYAFSRIFFFTTIYVLILSVLADCSLN